MAELIQRHHHHNHLCEKFGVLRPSGSVLAWHTAWSFVVCWCDTPRGALWCVGVTHRVELCGVLVWYTAWSFMVCWCDTPRGALWCVGVTHRVELYGVLVWHTAWSFMVCWCDTLRGALWCVPTKLGDKIKQNEMGRTCGTYGRQEKCNHGFVGEQTTLKT
jgi:hypothetical protein